MKLYFANLSPIKTWLKAYIEALTCISIVTVEQEVHGDTHTITLRPVLTT